MRAHNTHAHLHIHNMRNAAANHHPNSQGDGNRFYFPSYDVSVLDTVMAKGILSVVTCFMSLGQYI